MTCICAYYAFNRQNFSGHDSSYPDCFSDENSDLPIHENDADNITRRMETIITLGFYVHLFGLLAAGFMTFSLKFDYLAFRIASIAIFISFAWTWAIWFFVLHWVRFSHGGKVCSGDLFEQYEIDTFYNHMLEMGFALH